MNRDGYIDTNV